MTNQAEHSEAQASSQPVTLQEALQFDMADLAANRAGRLSEGQRARLWRNWQRGVVISISMIIFGILAATIFLYIGWRTYTTALTIVGITLTFFNAAVVGLLAQAYLRYRGDTADDAVVRLEGTATRTLRVNERARSAAYFIIIDGQELRVNKPVFNAIEDQGIYCVYRAPLSKQVLSAERLS